ncbi:extracellular catalytic domain type 2 short-chain-length polyhydroxyalkanoate depolymerase [Nonomuraea jabiensis]|uniref:Poly(3-hydroxybutyrate) depolymerase/chitodextrinase n=1 Tax=Nonomuraea jabiensis TaxID=882448 RepID=A0A7W9LG85_9ACTN|nr:PHB depolymerase family esterase [Nonomuraea jabiensis]MBB5782563.1 poly(3-hydroxybutyrate) depolymerase/chitodextrinase [Nonomuraea jabiensis]
MKVRHALVTLNAAFGLAASPFTPARAAVPQPQPGTLGKHDISGTYVSGLSSGGFMANQLHVAYSSVFKGAGIFSAGAYDCAQNNLNTALYACMDTFMARTPPARLVQLTRDRAAAGSIDPVQNLSGDPVWLYHGTADQTIDPAVNDDLATYYRDLGANVVYNNTSGAGHAWVSPIGSNACSATSSPYVNKCGTTDPVKEMLTHLYGTVSPAASSLTGKLIQFDQNTYAPGGDAGSISMGRDGFVYVPRQCEGGSCKLMVAVHGCYQYYGLVGDAFMDQAYLNEYADTNNMIVLYPQATTSAAGTNPRGCWDWWGYQSAQYPLKSGPQMTAIVNMVKALGGGGAPPATLPAPAGLSVTGTTNSGVSLSWTAVSGAASYNVYRDGSKVNSSAVTGTSYTDSGLSAGTTYTYTVAAVDNSGTASARSTAVTATTTGPSTVCVTANNYAHTVAGRAYAQGGQTYARGSNQPMGLWNTAIVHTLKQTGATTWVLADNGC